MADSIFNRHSFQAFQTTISYTVTDGEETATYAGQTLTNIDSVTSLLVNAVDKTGAYPFALAAGDSVEITIVQTDPNLDSEIVLTT